MANHGIEGPTGIILIPLQIIPKKIPASNCTHIKRTIQKQELFSLFSHQKAVFRMYHLSCSQKTRLMQRRH